MTGRAQAIWLKCASVSQIQVHRRAVGVQYRSPDTPFAAAPPRRRLSGSSAAQLCVAMTGSETLAAKATFFFTAACILGWTMAMPSTEWVAKKNAYYRLTGGLFTVKLEKGYIGAMARFMLDPVNATALQWLSQIVEAEYWLQDFREHMCSLPKIAGITDNVCGVAQHLVFSSWGLLICVWVSFAAMLSGSALIYRYVYV